MNKNVQDKSAAKKDNKAAAKKEKRKGIGKFFREINSELKKVSWPSRKELINYTIIVVSIILVFAAVTGVVDFGLGKILDLITS